MYHIKDACQTTLTPGMSKEAVSQHLLLLTGVQVG